MTTPKAQVARMLEALPENAGFEDIQYYVYVPDKIGRGLDRAQAEGAISHEDAKARLGPWRAL